MMKLKPIHLSYFLIPILAAFVFKDSGNAT